MSKAGRSVRAISSTRIWRQSGSINEVAGDSMFGHTGLRVRPLAGPRTGSIRCPFQLWIPAFALMTLMVAALPTLPARAEAPKLGGTLTYVIAAALRSDLWVYIPPARPLPPSPSVRLSDRPSVGWRVAVPH